MPSRDKRRRGGIAADRPLPGIGISNAVWGLDADTVVIDAAYHEAWPLGLSVIQAQFPDSRDLVNSAVSA